MTPEELSVWREHVERLCRKYKACNVAKSAGVSQRRVQSISKVGTKRPISMKENPMNKQPFRMTFKVDIGGQIHGSSLELDLSKEHVEEIVHEWVRCTLMRAKGQVLQHQLETFRGVGQ